jgi:hypothetical protein
VGLADVVRGEGVPAVLQRLHAGALRDRGGQPVVRPVGDDRAASGQV